MLGMVGFEIYLVLFIFVIRLWFSSKMWALKRKDIYMANSSENVSEFVCWMSCKKFPASVFILILLCWNLRLQSRENVWVFCCLGSGGFSWSLYLRICCNKFEKFRLVTATLVNWFFGMAEALVWHDFVVWVCLLLGSSAIECGCYTLGWQHVA